MGLAHVARYKPLCHVHREEVCETVNAQHLCSLGTNKVFEREVVALVDASCVGATVVRVPQSEHPHLCTKSAAMKPSCTFHDGASWWESAVG